MVMGDGGGVRRCEERRGMTWWCWGGDYDGTRKGYVLICLSTFVIQGGNVFSHQDADATHNIDIYICIYTNVYQVGQSVCIAGRSFVQIVFCSSLAARCWSNDRLSSYNFQCWCRSNRCKGGTQSVYVTLVFTFSRSCNKIQRQ